jgi:hypothetical protein
MVKFIFFCMAVVVLSFVAVPVFTGISNERDQLLAVNDAPTAEEQSLSFQEIYDIASDTSDLTPDQLNNITPAAGENQPDYFSSGFRGREDSALENKERFIEEETEIQQTL